MTTDELRASLAPLDCDPHDNARVVSLLATAAADAAARFHDRADLGGPDGELRWQWGKIVCLLNEVAEWASPALGAPDEPGELCVKGLPLVFAAHEQRWQEYREEQK